MFDIRSKRSHALWWLIALPVVNAYLTMWFLFLIVWVEGCRSLGGWFINYVIAAPSVFPVIWEYELLRSSAGRVYTLLALLPLLVSCVAWVLRPCRKTFFITLIVAFVFFGPLALTVIGKSFR